MKTRTSATVLAVSLLILTTRVADAHTGAGQSSGLMDGFLHPLGGLDHILAMVMVGLLAAQLGGRALWLVPASFVAAMIVGGGLGLAGLPILLVELGIGLSVIVLGAAVALHKRAAVPAAMALVGFFAVFHGQAHGTEMPESAIALIYGASFVTSTALLHAAGIGLASLINGRYGRIGEMLVRSAGAVAAIAGVSLVIGVI